MPPPKKHAAMGHDEARERVCAVCTNLWGYKAVRKVSLKEEELIQQKVLENYSSSNTFFPSGMCRQCMHDLHKIDRGEDVQLKLPENYLCDIERQTRSSHVLICTCRWCELARLYGPAFLLWQRKVKGKEVKKVVRLCQHCYDGILDGAQHSCSTSTLQAVKNLTSRLPKDIQDKLALEILKGRQAAAGKDQAVLLPPAEGGHLVPVLVGEKSVDPPPKPTFSHSELLTMASSAHLTGKQISTVASDLRVKLGRGAVQAGFDTAMVEHNNMYTDYFSAEKKQFLDSAGNLIEKPFFWCHDVKRFLELVAHKREKVLDECNVKIGGDTGKGWLKITASIFQPKPTSSNQKHKKRRTRDDGISGGVRFEETGQRMILLLAIVKGVPESKANLEQIFDLLNLTGLKFTITGDFKFLMPWFGLLGCSSVHPCLYCNSERRKGKWEAKEGTELRTLGGIEIMAGEWIEAGSKNTTAWTSKFESCVGMVTVWGVDDTPLTTVLDKCAPPTVHCLLALNNVLRPHLENIWDGDLWAFLREEVGVVPHSYQGKEGAFEGPQCSKILKSVEEKLKPHLLQLGEPGRMYYSLLVEFRRFKDTFFGTFLPSNYKDVATAFQAQLYLLHSTLGLPITPKLHMMAEHVLDWVDRHGRALGEESEQAVEAAHATFDTLWESFIVNDEASDIFLTNGCKALLKFNSDQTNASVVLVAEE